MSNKITLNDLRKQQVETGNVVIDVSTFNSLEGQLVGGLNILKLEIGQAAGPFKLSRILLNQRLGKPRKVKGKMVRPEPVDVYCAETAAGSEIRMPIAAGFVNRAKDAKLKVGDVFAVLREKDYEANGRKDCQSYQIKRVKV